MSETQLHNQEPATTLPGAILKRCREFHGITLSEAAETTKIGVNYLTALEEDKISEFASLAYLKGFLRIYAKHLGLNPEDMLRIYERLYDPPVQPPQTVQNADSEVVYNRGFRWHKLLLPAMLLLLMFVAAGILNHKTTTVLPPKTASPVASTPDAALPQIPVQAAISSVQDQTSIVPPKTESRPNAVKPPVEIAKPESPVRRNAPEVPKSFIAGMKVTRNGSLSVIIDGAAPQQYELNAGDRVEWKAEKSIALELSNGGGVEIDVDGKPLAPLISSGAPTYVVIDAEGIKK